MNSPELDPKAGLGLIAATSTIFLWTIGNLLVKSVDMPGVQIAFWRVVMAAVIYAMIVRAMGRRITIDQLRTTAPAGIAISLEIAVFFVAIKTTTVANATVIGALQPLVLLAVASKRFGERVTGGVVLISLVALGGVGLVVFGSSPDATWNPFGDFLAVLAMLLFAAYFALAKAARETVPAMEFQAGVWIVGTVTLLPVAVIDAGGIFVPSGWNWLWLTTLVFVPGTGHLLMNWAHSHVRLIVTSTLMLGIPVLSTAGAVLFLDESVSWPQIAGMFIVLSALAAVIGRETVSPSPASLRAR